MNLVDTSPYLLCKAPIVASLDISGNIFVSSVISLSGGILTPAVVPSVRPVNPCIQFRTPAPAAAVARILEFVVPGALAVVTTSSSGGVWLLCLEFVPRLEVSGKARLLRRGGRLEPKIGWRKRFAKLVVVGPMR